MLCRCDICSQVQAVRKTGRRTRHISGEWTILPRRLGVCHWTYKPSAKAKRDETAYSKAITEQADSQTVPAAVGSAALSVMSLAAIRAAQVPRSRGWKESSERGGRLAGALGATVSRERKYS